MRTLRKILDLFPARERPRLAGMLLLMIVVALVEVIGVASIMPFMGVLARPDLITNNAMLKGVYMRLGFTAPDDFLFFLGCASLTLLLAGNFLNAFSSWATTRFIYLKGHALSEQLLRKYAGQPYEFYFSRNTTELGKNILAEVDRVVTGVLVPVAQVIAKSVVTLLILSILVLTNPTLALTIGLVLGGTYIAIYLFMRDWLVGIARGSMESSSERYKDVAETLGGIKELRLLGREEDMIRRFARASLSFARYQSAHQASGNLPRFLLESLAFGGMIFIVLFLLRQGGDLGRILPLLSLYALAGYRLMPALQQVFGGLTSLGHHSPGLDLLHRDLMDGPQQTSMPVRQVPLPARRSIEFRNVRYCYPDRDEPALNDISLTIAVGTTVAFIGRSGAGKTTAAEILLGVLSPTAGCMAIDGIPLETTQVRAWQGNIGYVPQSIYLADDTVAANIAFGVFPEAVDQAAVERAARMANIHDFIVGELPQGYATVIGDRGVRLSGGQRQRLGIARALYRDPAVLVLDEGTSALDHQTEEAIIETIHSLARKKTILMIAHRLQTIRECDQIFCFELGLVRSLGSDDEFQLIRNLEDVLPRSKNDLESPT